MTSFDWVILEGLFREVIFKMNSDWTRRSEPYGLAGEGAET